MVRKISIMVGTRPELVKLAPLIREGLRRGWEVQTIISGQHHPELLDPLLDFFEIQPTIAFDKIESKGNLNFLSGELLKRLSVVSPGEIVVCQGDTTTAMTAALWGFHGKAQVAHVEAGLRTYDLQSPFPEEANRQIIGRIADFHFAPTESAVRNLTAEGIDRKKIFRVGNTGIDSLMDALDRLDLGSEQTQTVIGIERFLNERPMVLITTHRRENHGEPLRNILRAITNLAFENPDVGFVLPVHPNPMVSKIVTSKLSGIANVLLIDPLPYPDFVWAMDRASVIVSDSGGVQEEAPSLNKPIIVLRENTERPEAVDFGYAKLVGHNSIRIIQEVNAALLNGCLGEGGNPYGDGFASRRIFDNLESMDCQVELPLRTDLPKLEPHIKKRRVASLSKETTLAN